MSSRISRSARRALQVADLDAGDGADLVLVQRVEDDDLVEPVDELGPEVPGATTSITASFISA
jgi:hypothetical protein